MEKIYGNEYLVATLSNMIRNGKTANSVIFYGEKGCGKKLMAKYYTLLLLCEKPVDGKPCGKCNACVNTESFTHPDVTYAQKSGKLGGFSVETARAICSDAFIKPNNSSGRKIYIFPDCRNMDVRTQNTLLKIIEEPPEYAYFIFTSDSKSDFLATIVSRCVCFGLSPCTEEQTTSALKDKGFEDNDVYRAMSAFHGNIGRCIEYLSDSNVRRIVDLTKSIADSIIRKDEYALNVAFFTLGKERADVRTTLSLLDRLIRDAAVLGKDTNAVTISCYREGAVKLASMLTAYQAARIHRLIEKANSAVELNINISLALAALSGDIMSCM